VDEQAAEDQRLSAGHGPYARAAREELSIRPDDDAPLGVRAANSNTAPATRGATGGVRTAAEETPPTVVPLPVRPRSPATPPVAVQAGVDNSAAPAVPIHERANVAPAADGMVDIVMQRETATFRVPVSQATLPVTLFSTDGNLAEVLAPPLGAVPEHPHAAPSQALIETIADDQQDLFDVNDFESLAEDDIDGVAQLAGRLRPAFPRG
jgi:hypothetical protein